MMQLTPTPNSLELNPMANQHSITPPPGLVDQWIEQSEGDHPIPVAIKAAQWGYGQALLDTISHALEQLQSK